MKRSNQPTADRPASLLKVTLYPETAAMSITYNNNDISVLLSDRCPPGTSPTVIDCTEDPSAVQCGNQYLIYNAARHHHVVASYYPDDNCLVIKHLKRVYGIMLPNAANLISCGGEVSYLAQLP